MSTWITPKIDWVSTDFFNIEDYNRIKGNLLYLQDMLNKLFPRVTYDDMGNDKQYVSMIYAREFNTLESNLSALNLDTYNLSIGEQPTYVANGTTPLFAELNRIEGAMLSLYNRATTDIAIMPRYSFRLGNMKGVKL